MAHRTSSSETDYEELLAVVVDAIDYWVKPENLNQAAHAVLDGLRNNGLKIPSDPSA